MEKALRELNALAAKIANEKPTVKSLEEHAKGSMEEIKKGSCHDPEAEKKFYKGFLRAIEILRQNKLLKE